MNVGEEIGSVLKLKCRGMHAWKSSESNDM